MYDVDAESTKKNKNNKVLKILNRMFLIIQLQILDQYLRI